MKKNKKVGIKPLRTILLVLAFAVALVVGFIYLGVYFTQGSNASWKDRGVVFQGWFTPSADTVQMIQPSENTGYGSTINRGTRGASKDNDKVPCKRKSKGNAGYQCK
jgi:hypothetical protein